MREGSPLVTISKIWGTRRWLPAYVWQLVRRRQKPGGIVHLIIAVADHFEPAFEPAPPWGPAPYRVQQERLERWCREYPEAVGPFPDSDGCRLRHTYFYPAEQYDRKLIERLAIHCHEGWGEIEVHLHHGVKKADVSAETLRVLVEFRDRLVGHGCLCRWAGSGQARYAFVHGNWALANSDGGRNCGVDDELQILAETGCYADFTLPSAPSTAQVGKINALYECSLPLNRRSPHRKGRDLRVGRRPQIFPLIVQGPLMVDFTRVGVRSLFPGIENSEVSVEAPPNLTRLHAWKRCAICVGDRPEWLFIKLHCHGMDPRDENVMFGAAIQRFLAELTGFARQEGMDRLHFVTAREMVNIALAACDGAEGNPGDYRNYRLKLTN